MAEETGEKENKRGKSGVKKYQWWIVGGVVLLAVIFFAVKKSNQNSNAAPSNANLQGSVDPATGYLYGSPADMAALGQTGSSSEGGPVGAQGPAGPQGPPGPAGPAGVSAPTGPAVTPSQHPPIQIGGGTLAPSPAINSSQGYTVGPRDTLWGIATKFYGNGNQWPKIYHANQGVIGGNPDLIHPGQRLTIPG